jgi:hypothetical protein
MQVVAPTHSNAVDPATAFAPAPEVFVGVFLALLASFLVFSYSGTGIMRFPDRSIGIGVIQGVDASRRASIYLLMVVTSLATGLACFYGARSLRRSVPGWFVGVRSALESDLCALFGTVGSAALVIQVASNRLEDLTAVSISLAGLVSVLGVALVRRWSKPGPRGRLLRGLTAWSTTAPLLLLLWPSLQIVGVSSAAKGAGSGPGLWSLALPVGYALALFCLCRWPGRHTRARMRHALAASATPLFLFPGLCPVANELQYALAAQHLVSPREVAKTLLAGLALVSCVLFALVLRGRLRLAPGRLLARVGFPALVFGATLTSVHQQFFAKTVDPLHDGEQITSVHQLLQFSKWPFVDVWPAHGLFDYVGVLYAQVNGFRPFELTAWNGVLAGCAAVGAYAILASVSTPLFAFVVALLLPIDSIFPLPMYSYFCAEPTVLAAGLLACWVAKRPSPLRYALLASMAALCFFWTPANGVAVIAAVLALLLLDCRVAVDRALARRGLFVFVATGVGIFFAYALVLVASSRPVFETLHLILAFIRADPMVAARGIMIERFDAMAFFQYIVLPGIGLLYLGKLVRHAIERRPLDRVSRILGFLTLVSLVMFMRAFNRHSLLERYQPFFFPLLALVALMMPGAAGAAGAAPPASQIIEVVGAAARSSRHAARRALGRGWFCAGLALYLVSFPMGAQARLGLTAFKFQEWRAEQPRFLSPVPVFPKLRAFLDATLRPSDTFLELLNMPLLYTLFEREMPAQFFFISMFYATDGVQNTYLERFDAFGGSDRVPVVLLNTSVGEAHIDGIPNTLRSYRLAERVYRDYVPYGTIDGFDVWVSRKRWSEAAQRVSPVPLAFSDPDQFQVAASTARVSGDGSLRLTATGPEPQVDGVVRLDGIPVHGGLESHHALRFSYRTRTAGTLEIYVRRGDAAYDGAKPSRLAMEPGEPEWKTGQIALPIASDPALPLTGLRIDPPDGGDIELKDLELVYGAPETRAAESSSLGMLPFVWGNFDPRLEGGSGRVLERLSWPQRAGSRRGIDLTVSSMTLDTSSGNYLRLCIKLPRKALEPAVPLRRWPTVAHRDSWQSAGTMTLSYGSGAPSTFQFDLVRPDPASPGLPDSLVESFTHDCKAYVIRLSTQYAWRSEQPVARLHLESNVPVTLERAELLAGD